MDLKRLEEFTVLVGAGSFRKAAAELGLPPAVLSSHIDALEKKLGVRLLERDAHHMALTEAGRRFLGEARELCTEYQQMIGGIRPQSASGYRSLRIGISGFAMPASLGPYLDSVVLRYPDIRLDILGDSRYGAADGLREGYFDLFFSYAPADLQYPDTEREFVYDTHMQVLLPSGHHLANKSSVSLTELDGERFVLYPLTAEPAQHRCELELLQRSGISFSIYEGEVCPSAYFIMVPVGKGLALCPWPLRALIPPNSVAVSVSGGDFAISMYMYYRRDCPNPYLAEFLEGFRDFLKRRDEL